MADRNWSKRAAELMEAGRANEAQTAALVGISVSLDTLAREVPESLRELVWALSDDEALVELAGALGLPTPDALVELGGEG